MNTLRAIALIVRRSLRQHALSTTITALSVALGVGLLMSVFAIQKQTLDAFTGGTAGFDAVFGPRGSKLQLVLNSVFHLEKSQGNLPWRMYQDIKRHPAVAEAIPYAVGDNYRDFRIVGTTTELFTDHEIREGEKFQFQGDGRVFEPSRAEAIIGSFAARETGLGVGDQFYSYHGLTFDESQIHADMVFTIVGVLEPTNTPADRVIWVPLEAYYRMPGHWLQGSGVVYQPQPGVPIPQEHKEVSAVMIKLKAASAGRMMEQMINRQGNAATFAWPIGQTLADLFEKLGWAHRVLTLVAYLVMVVAAGSVLASIYNAMNERRREFAILRALGARRSVLVGAIVGESAAIAALGAVVGFVVYFGLLALVSMVIRSQVGVIINVWQGHPVLWIGPLATVALGALVGTVPAVKAYSTDVATHLTPST